MAATLKLTSLAEQIRSKIEGTPKLRRRPAERPELEPEEARVLDLITEFVNLNGVPPTDSETALVLEITPSTVNKIVWALVAKKYVWRNKGKARWTVILP